MTGSPFFMMGHSFIFLLKELALQRQERQERQYQEHDRLSAVRGRRQMLLVQPSPPPQHQQQQQDLKMVAAHTSSHSSESAEWIICLDKR